MGFKASTEVEALAYDFNPFADSSGVIPEPSSDQVAAYRSKIFAALNEAGVDSEEKISLKDMDTVLAKVADIDSVLVDATASLTGLDVNIIAALPFRVRSAFCGWLVGVFLSPEA